MELGGLKRLFWFITFFLTLHNIEEALTMPQWMDAHLPLLKERIPIFQFLTFSSTQLYVSLVLVTLIPFIVSFLCLRGELSGQKITMMLTLQSIIFWNALMPHLSGAILLGMYNPGTVTAVLFNIPFTVYVIKKVKTFETAPAFSIKAIFSTGALVYLPLVYTNHLIAKAIANLL